MKICVFTGSRGEWGYLLPILKLLSNRVGSCEFELVVTNMHLLPEYGYSLEEIENDGFFASHAIPIFGTSDSKYATVTAMGRIIDALSGIFFNTQYDYLLIAGDRFESLAAATAAFYADIPVAHIQAGEKSGNKDDASRHAIARLASLHFAANCDAENRLLTSGEEPWRVHNTGAPQIDGLKNYISDRTGPINECLCVLHPETLGIDKNVSIDDIIDFLLAKNYQIHCVFPNSDAGSQPIFERLLAKADYRLTKHRNLPRSDYLMLLSKVDFIIGNSSSAILEAPTFKTPAINIGSRQRGRVQGVNVVNIADSSVNNLEAALNKIARDEFKENLRNCENPYGLGNSAEKIIDILMLETGNGKLLFKELTI